MVKTKYTVDVLVPTFNCVNHIEECLASIFNQVKLPDRIIISDDASDDGTVEKIEEVISGQSRVEVSLIRQGKNLGPVGNHNFLSNESRADYISFINSDDYYDVSRIEQAAEYFGYFDFIFSQAQSVGAADTSKLPDGQAFERCRGLKQAAKEISYKNHTISTGNHIFRRDFFLSTVGGYNYDHPYCHDWRAAASAMIFGSTCFLKSPLYNYRYHKNNLHRKYAGRVNDEVRLIQDYLQQTISKASPVSILHKRFGITL